MRSYTCVLSDLCDSDCVMAESSRSSPASVSELTLPAESSDASETVSLLSRLGAPSASDLAWKHKVSSNPPIGRKRSKGSLSSDPKSVSPSDQVKQYPDQQLTVSAGKLFCCACKEEL